MLINMYACASLPKEVGGRSTTEKETNNDNEDRGVESNSDRNKTNHSNAVLRMRIFTVMTITVVF